ncbi:Der1-like family protein [Nitzschia inconspicua]|uniref:Derlin n=1 Tax=Nitzschia inconspicua TaxID=303405 RepID=A0A9K3M3D9_9STRA|nr:Der1-like family protein [Nitzschia inconspicua]
MPFANPGENRGGVGDTPGPDAWFKSLPIVTQYWFGATMVITLSTNFGIINPYQIMWSWTGITQSFEFWRFLTPFLFAGGFSFNTLIACYMLVQFSKQYESGGPFNTGAGGGTADYAFCMLLGVGLMLVSYPVVSGWFALPPVFCQNLIYYVLYIWSKRNPTAQANIWGFPMQGIYLPFAYLLMTVFMGNPYMPMLHGMVIGHIYYFMVDVIPAVYGKDFIQTPRFLIDYFGVGHYQPEAAPVARPANNNNNAAGRGGHVWGGGGQRLGTN